MNTMKVKRICAGTYEVKMNVTLTYLDGKTESLPATATIESMEEAGWEKGTWNLNLTAIRGNDEITLTNCDEVYYSKRTIVASLKAGHLNNWRRVEGLSGWCI